MKSVSATGLTETDSDDRTTYRPGSDRHVVARNTINTAVSKGSDFRDGRTVTGVTSATSAAGLTTVTEGTYDGTRTKSYTAITGDDYDDYGDDDEEEEGDYPSYQKEFPGFSNPFHISSLSGEPQCNALLLLWQLVMLVVSASLLMVGIGLKLYFSFLVISHVNNLPMFDTYNKFMVKADEHTTELVFSDLEQFIGVVFIISHGLYTFSHLFYITYAIHRLQFTLPTSALITGLVAAAEISMVNVFLSPELIAKQDVVEGLQDKLSRYTIKSHDQFMISYEYLSVWMKCCGITDHWDFLGIKDFYLVTPVGINKTVQVPVLIAPTCCKREIFSATADHVTSCAHNSDHYTEAQAQNYSTGCFTLLVEYIKIGCKYYALVIWVHLADVGIHAAVYKGRVTFFANVVDEREEKQAEKSIKELRRKLIHQSLHMGLVSSLYKKKEVRIDPKFVK